MKRDCGVFSNCTVLIKLLLQMALQNYFPLKIEQILSEYQNYNLYDLFTIEGVQVEKFQKASQIFRAEIDKFVNKVPINLQGFGTNREEIPMNILKFVTNAYFHPNEKVKHLLDSFDLTTDSTFVWWRKLDKVDEITWQRRDARYPNIQELRRSMYCSKTVQLQTDDAEIQNEFQTDPAVKILQILPIIAGKTGFHISIKEMTDLEYSKKYNHSRHDQMSNLMSLAFFASRCKFFVGYPGNISMFICVLRQSFNRVLFFKNQNEFF